MVTDHNAKRNEGAREIMRIQQMPPREAAMSAAAFILRHAEGLARKPLPAMPDPIRRQSTSVDKWQDDAWDALAVWRLQVAQTEADNAASMESCMLAIRALRECDDEEARAIASQLAVLAGRVFPALQRVIGEAHGGVLPQDIATIRKLAKWCAQDLSWCPAEWRTATKPFAPPPRRKG